MMEKYDDGITELNEMELEAVNAGASGKTSSNTSSGQEFMFLCQNPKCARAFAIKDLSASVYVCPYCGKRHISCG